uniref:tetratricopeptide repeat-containing sulfotransferase family protein n=1 Tax=Synechococcus sp. UW106 TaxID=368495 RepID=UPI000E0FCA79|nr:tetratricopeptide repeat-containing sulfotransferase family protein [Synechococcus sp. UW106]
MDDSRKVSTIKFRIANMVVDISRLTQQLKQNNFNAVLTAAQSVPEQNKTDDFKLLELVARVKTDQSSPMVQHYLNESAGWSFEHPELLLRERAFLALLNNEGAPAIRLYKEIDQAELTGIDLNRLGTAHLLISDFNQALAYYDRAIELEPDEPSHRNNKGGALARLQRFDLALDVYDECLELDPKHSTAKEARQKLLIKMNQSEDLLEDLKQKLDDDPESLEKRLAYFNALVQFTQYGEAIKVIQTQLKPVDELKTIPLQNDPEDYKLEQAQINLRTALCQLFESRQMWNKALVVTNQLLKMFEEAPYNLLFSKADILSEIGQYDAASKIIDELDDKVNDKERIKLARALLLCEQGKETEALELFESFDKGSRFYRQILHKKADIKLTLGRIEDSHDDLLELLDTNIMVAVQLINSKNYKPDDSILEKLKLIARNPFTAEQQRENLCFALGLACDKRKEFADAAEFLREANSLNRKKIKYNPEEFTQRCNRHIRFYQTAQGPQRAKPLAEATPNPIFIVGMPRSGTTLTETIIGSHSLVAPCGELSSIPKISRFINQNYKKLKPYPECIDALTPNMLSAMAETYIRNLPEEGEGATYTADKLPHNFVNVGLIHRIFPDAPIIHVMRDPRDNGLSNFQQNFGAKYGGMGFAFDLEHLANEINNYWRLMKHWRKIGIPMIEFWYEDLVAEQEVISKALIQYCGLGWEDNVLDFHKLKRRVKTASVGQVRNKMYKTSAQKWRNYEELLQPMIEALDTSVVEFYEPGEQSS